MRKVLSFVAIGSHHALAVWGFIVAETVPSRVVSPDVIMTVFIQPTISKNAPTQSRPDLSRLSFQIHTPLPAIDVDVPQVEYDVARNTGATSVAPSLDAVPRVDMAPFARSAALLPGEGATVVLRIEVLKDGLPGHIAVDVSSGSTQIDEAAMAYARAHRWEPAMAAGNAERMWIRWGVRLQA